MKVFTTSCRICHKSIKSNALRPICKSCKDKLNKDLYDMNTNDILNKVVKEI